MGKAAAARKLASAAAYGGGGLSVLGAGLYGVLRAEASLARHAIGNAGDEPPPDSTGWYGRGRPGPAIKVALLGDSSAAGYGVDRAVETPGAHLASGIAAGADRRVHLRAFARVGAQSSDLAGQIDRALATDPDLTVIMVGANDVTHQVRPSQSVRHLGAGVRRLREAGSKVVVGTCPDLGTIKPIPPPLQAAGPIMVATAGRCPGDRDRRGGRGRGVARLGARPRLRGGPRTVLRSRPVPPVGRGLPRPRGGAGSERGQHHGLR